MNTKTLIAPAWKEQFDELGYCIVDSLYAESELEEIEAFFDEHQRKNRAIGPDEMRLTDLNPAKEQVRYIHPHKTNDKAKQWMIHPRVGEVLKVLFNGRDPLAVQSMYYYKPPGAKGQGMHQDNYYLLAAPATCMAAWTPIDDADKENGCLWASPRSQHLDIFCPGDDREAFDGGWNNYGDSHIEKFPREYKPVPIPVKRGQTLFFGGNFIHGSGPNRSKTRSRRTFIGHYVDRTTEKLAKFYHPISDFHGNTVTDIAVEQGGGPCGDSWQGGNYH